MQLRCLIVDDEPLAVNLLQQYVEAVPYLSLSHKCYNAMDALAYLHQNKAELIFLDINLPKITGLQLAKALPQGQKIIFTTAYSEHAVESYELNAVDYLLKPITFDRFIKAVNKVVESFKLPEEEQSVVSPPQKEEHLFIKSGKAIVQVFFHQILYIEGLKDYVSFHTAAGKHIVYKRMKDLEALLPSNFSRVHHSFIVNRQHIRKIEDHHLSIGEERIPLSEKYRDAFYAVIQKHTL